MKIAISEQTTEAARGLAYIGKVTELHPIAEADRIESAVVVCGAGGRWTGVVKKGDFSIGDRCSVLLQDAVVKPDERWNFLERSGWRVRMARFRGAPSECVILPPTDGFEVGDDITESLGVEKYQKAIHASLAGDAIGDFPPFIPKTDEPNYQRARQLMEALDGLPYVVTVKADGSSGTAYRHDGRFGVCSRNQELKEGPTGYWRVAKKYGIHERLPEGYAVQYEVVGPKIQSNPLGLKEIDALAFSVWDIANREYLGHDEFVSFCADIGFPTVDIVKCGESFCYSDDDLRLLAEGLYPGGKQREGVVIRSRAAMRVAGERLSFKVINLLYRD